MERRELGSRERAALSASAKRPPLELRLEGHLTDEALRLALGPVEREIASGASTHGLIVDCRDMTGYDAAARARFVTFNRTHRLQISRTAVVTTNRLWHMVISAMSLAAIQPMKPFPELESARAWLNDTGPASVRPR